MVEQVCYVVKTDPRLTVQQIACIIGISAASVFSPLKLIKVDTNYSQMDPTFVDRHVKNMPDLTPSENCLKCFQTSKQINFLIF